MVGEEAMQAGDTAVGQSLDAVAERFRDQRRLLGDGEIGRASCRERV